MALIFISNYAMPYNNTSHEVPAELTLSFTGKSFKTYINLLNKVNKTHGDTIFTEFKKKFKINGYYFDVDGKKKFISGRARISGDLKDHLNFKKLLASLSISLKKTNIGGVTKFRLLLPETRASEYEIFWSSLMEEVGFPVPLRKFINVNFMGSDHIFIFEEKPEKEFLESIGFREAPIIEYDERQMYANREERMKGNKRIRLWNDRKELFVEQYKIKNRDFIKNDVSEIISLKAISNIPPKSKSIEYFDKLNIRYAAHGLNKHNRKFIYDPIYNDYIPIYFDGNIKAKIMKDDCINFNISSVGTEVIKKINILDAKFYERTLKTKNLNKDMKCVAAKIFNESIKLNFNKSEIKPIKNIILNQKNNIKNPLEGLKVNGYPNILDIKPNQKTIYRLKYNDKKKKWLKNEDVDYKKLTNILVGNDKSILIENYKVFDIVNFNYNSNYLEKFNIIKIDNQSIEVDVKENETYYIKLTASKSKININLLNKNSKVIFYQSNINESKIFINTKESNNENRIDNSIRYDSRLLTSCSTFIDSKIKNTLISSENCKLEDGLNFVRSKGHNISVFANNSMFDGLDADFSTLNFSKVSIDKSGNDCIDVSSGTYNFEEINARMCGDKAISIGEKSLVAINNADIDTAKIGLAVKDFSDVSLNSLQKNNLEFCINAYQKKQEFGPGIIRLNKKINNCKVSLKNESKLMYTNVCSKVQRNYFYDTCQQKDMIKFFVKKPLPKASLFYLNKTNKKTGVIENMNFKIQNKYSEICKINERCEFEIKLDNDHLKNGVYDSDFGNYNL